MEGDIPAGENSIATLTLSAADVEEEVSREADLVIHNNGREPAVTIPITVEFGAESVGGRAGDPIPTEFWVGEAYPNPFNSSTMVRVAFPNQARLRVGIYDLQGRLVEALGDNVREAGMLNLQVKGRDLASGMYLLRVTAGDRETLRKLILLR